MYAELDQGQLVLSADGAPYPLLAMGEEQFLIRSGLTTGEVVFGLGEGGKAYMRVQIEGQRSFEYVPISPGASAAPDLDEYVGSYYCVEVDATQRVRLDKEKSKLLLEGMELEDPSLQPMFQDGFRWEWGSLVFERGADESISGFRLNAGRARNFRFERRGMPKR